jgi:hypothetical protein
LDLEFELEQLEIETGLDALENIDEIEKFTKIVQQSLRLVAKTRMCHHLEDLQQHRYCGTRQLASVELMTWARLRINQFTFWLWLFLPFLI